MKYTEQGYIDFAQLMKDKNPFIFIVGGRGSGKTFGAIQYALREKKTFFFMRRTQTQIDMIRNDAFSPFKAVNESICVATISKGLTGVYYGQQDQSGSWSPSGAPIGYMCALSTISNIRGFDASMVDLIIFDEFIGEAHERPIRNEGSAFLNAYETINRNRELDGREPVQLLALANSNSLANPIFVELELVTPVEKMLRNGQDAYCNAARGVSVYMVNHSPVLDAKSRTALYRLAGEGEYAEMALENKFTKEEMDRIESRDLKPYRLICTVGEICVYKRKDNADYYITGHKAGSTQAEYKASPMDLKRFKRDQYFLWLAYLKGKIFFESYIQKVLFERYFAP